MDDRRKRECDLIAQQFTEVDVGPNLDWVLFRRRPLGAGWNKGEISVLVLVPPGYPVTPPDNFYTDPDLRLANGQVPGNASTDQTVLGQPWLQFSYHVEGGDWQPHADVVQGHNLLTFLAGVVRRLAEAS